MPGSVGIVPRPFQLHPHLSPRVAQHQALRSDLPDGELSRRVRRPSRTTRPPVGALEIGCLFSVRSSVLRWGLSSRVACHPGYRRTLVLLQQSFLWPSMVANTQDFVATCSVCACSKASYRTSAGLLCPLTIPSCPWSQISVDFVTGLSPLEGNTTILTTVESFSQDIESDRGPQFTSQVIN